MNRGSEAVWVEGARCFGNPDQDVPEDFAMDSIPVWCILTTRRTFSAARNGQNAVCYLNTMAIMLVPPS